MSTELNLLPCPFCGGQPKIHLETLDERYAYANVVKVQCTSCGVAVSATGDTSKPGYADNSTTEKRAVEAWNRRASPAAAVPEGALPPLPEPCKLTLPTGWIRYTAEQMQAHARAAVEADRARQQDMSVRLAGAPAGQRDATITLLRNTVDLQHSTIVKLEATLADRAQQGEPVGYEQWAAENLPEYHSGRAPTWEIVEANVRMETRNAWIAATKAAAPADAPTDLPKRLRIKAGVMASGEKIAWGSDTELMLEAADYIERAAPVPDTGIPTAGEVGKADAVAWALVSPKGGIKKVAITRASVESRMARWLEEWPGNTPRIRPLIYGDAAAAPGEDA